MQTSFLLYKTLLPSNNIHYLCVLSYTESLWEQPYPSVVYRNSVCHGAPLTKQNPQGECDTLLNNAFTYTYFLFDSIFGMLPFVFRFVLKLVLNFQKIACLKLSDRSNHYSL